MILKINSSEKRLLLAAISIMKIKLAAQGLGIQEAELQTTPAVFDVIRELGLADEMDRQLGKLYRRIEVEEPEL